MPSLWQFYFVRNCRHTKPKPKSKHVVIVCRDGEDYYGFLVNSEIRPFIINRPELFYCQVLIKQSDYPTILEHDSYVDCTKAYPFSATSLAQPGFLKTATKDKIKKVVRDTTVLEEIYRRLILSG